MAKILEQVISDIDGILARAEVGCVSALTPVMSVQRPNQIFACLELFHMQSYQLVYNAFSVNDGKLVTDYACLPGFDGQKSFIPELATYFQTLISQQELNQADGEAFTSQHETQFATWFKKIWTAAGGETAKIPVYFCYEKEYMVQDLETGEVMEELEAAQSLGHAVTE